MDKGTVHRPGGTGNRKSQMNFARQTAAAAAKELRRKGTECQCPTEIELVAALLAEASAYDSWQLHAGEAEMKALCLAEFKKAKGRAIGGRVAAAKRRILAAAS